MNDEIINYTVYFTGKKFRKSLSHEKNIATNSQNFIFYAKWVK